MDILRIFNRTKASDFSGLALGHSKGMAIHGRYISIWQTVGKRHIHTAHPKKVRREILITIV